jgi:CheY-like chemotaxis protein
MGRHILVAGKSEQNLALTREAFEELEYLIAPAPTLSLALFLAQKNLPLLIVSSNDLGDGDVRTFQNELKIDAELRHVPLVFLLEPPVDPEHSKELMRNGAKCVMPNTESADEFRRKVAPWLRPPHYERLLSSNETTE